MTLKRLMSPGFWPIEKKTKKFVVQPRPGPHDARRCLPLAVIIRDVLHYADSMREVRDILNAGHVRVDGVIRKEGGFPVGFMDVLSVGDEHYRISVGTHNLCLEKIGASEANTKLLRVENKTTVRGKIQLNLHDGKNMLIDKNHFATGDVLVYDLAAKSVKETVKMETGATALITGGSNMGALCRISEIIVTRSSMPNQVSVDLGDRKIVLPKNYIFVVGKDTPVVTLGGRNEKH